MTDRNNKKIGGRPRLGATEKRKYLLPPVRLNTTEYFYVKGQASQASVSLTEYQRQCILNSHVVERIRPEHLELYRQLAGIGNNQNQLAHQANTYGYYKDAEMYHENAQQVSNLINRIVYDGEDN